MKVLVTGAAGFVGAATVRSLVDNGHKVVALVRPTSNLWRLADVASRITLLQGDLADTAALQSLAALQPDACIHLAWYAEPGKYLQSPLNLSALQASLALLQTLLATSCERVVMAGTCAEYDDRRGWLHEDGPTRPQTIYAAAKLSLALLGEQLAASSGARFAWARLFYLYGPQEDERRMVPALLRALLAGETFPASAGTQVRDYLHVHDVATGLVTLAEQAAAGIYNVASGNPVTVRQVMETAETLVGTPGLVQFGAQPLRPWDPPFICGDSSRLRALGWSPRYTLQEGVLHTLDWWRQPVLGKEL